MVDTRVTLCGIELDNPVMAASGTFGYGKEFAELYDINMLGSFSFKGTTLNPKAGNAQPRIAEGRDAIINSIGLENPGVDVVIAEKLPELEKIFNKKVMANIGGGSIEEYIEVASRLDKEDIVGWLEINVSCPNVSHGGMSFGTDPDLVEEVTREVRKNTKKPVIIKLTPNVTDITAIAKAAERGGADAVCLINTIKSMRIDLKKRQPIIANKIAGLSGPAVFPIALAMVYQVYEAVDIPVIGVGGISSAEDVIEMMLAGATAVEIGAANLVDPFACKKIIEELPLVMEKYGIDRLEDIIGGGH